MGNIAKGAWEEQSQVGWIYVAQGRLSKKWGEAQGKYYYAKPDLQSRKDCSVLNWMKTMISALCDMSLTMWKNRCDSLHGRTQEETVQKRRNKLRKKIEWCFCNQRLIPVKHHRIFQIDVETLCTKRSPYMI